MFINCPNCRALVATDPATDEPPERCPRCAAPLRLSAAIPGADVVVEAAATEHSVAHIAAAAEPERVVVAGAAASHPAVVEPTPVETPLPVAIDPPAHTAPEPALPAVRPLAALLKSASRDPPPETDAGTTEPDPDTGSEDRSDNASLVDARPIDEQHDRADARDDDAIVSPATVPASEKIPAPPTVSVPDKTAPAAKPAPSFVRAPAATVRTGWKSIAAIAALAVALVLQLLLADRANLAAQAQWRPLVSALCGAFGCRVPPWHEPEAFALLARDVQPHPAKPGVLRVTATFRNDARWAQPWPRLRLTLSDIDGNPVAAREFAPRDYLGAAPTQSELASGQSASIAMDVVEPDARSVAFDFALR